MNYPAYDKYKDSGVEWFDKVPSHWAVRRLKYDANYWVSNVDKVSADDEEPVRLCNYTDVYYNDYIHADMDFMETTATPEEIRRFGLKVGDVLITKDSEDWRDIAIPALVTETADDLVCGYHLAMVRGESRKLNGAFLFRCFQAASVNQQFQVASSGITRYGLPKSAIGEAWLPIPPLDEQQRIANFLDAQTAKIDALIARKLTLVEKLKERRAALISQVVTRGLPPEAARAAGLNPHPKLKPSGIDWLGDVPEHWDVNRGRFLMHVNPASQKLRALSDDDEVSFVPMDAVGENGGLRLDEIRTINEVGSGYVEFDDGDVVVAKITPCFENGKGALAKDLKNGVALATTELHVLRTKGPILKEFLFYHTISIAFRLNGEAEMYGSGGQKRVPPDFCRDYPYAFPALHEQKLIVSYLNAEIGTNEETASKVLKTAHELRRLRSSIIIAAITGSIDVRVLAS